MTILLFIIILAVLIFVHELGHFLVAKWRGIRVDEFALGFPPKIYSKKVGETTYALNLIPFGGYVKIFGEDPDAESMAGPDSSRSFVNKSAWTKIAVLVAGVSANVILAWLLFSISFMSGMTGGIGEVDPQYVENERVIVTSVLPESPAAEAGFAAGDEIRNYPTVEEIQELIKGSEGSALSFDITSGTEEKTIEVVPEQGVVEGADYGIGISMDLVGDIRLPVHLAFYHGLRMTWDMARATIVGLGGFLADIFTGDADFASVAGPVGIAGLVGEARELGWAYLLSFTAFISLNLAVLNLLPFPALDGGRILFVIIEAIKRSPIKPAVANTVNAIGFGLLILLMVVVTVKDILKLF